MKYEAWTWPIVAIVLFLTLTDQSQSWKIYNNFWSLRVAIMSGTTRVTF